MAILAGKRVDSAGQLTSASFALKRTFSRASAEAALARINSSRECPTCSATTVCCASCDASATAAWSSASFCGGGAGNSVRKDARVLLPLVSEIRAPVLCR